MRIDNQAYPSRVAYLDSVSCSIYYRLYYLSNETIYFSREYKRIVQRHPLLGITPRRDTVCPKNPVYLSSLVSINESGPRFDPYLVPALVRSRFLTRDSLIEATVPVLEDTSATPCRF